MSMTKDLDEQGYSKLSSLTNWLLDKKMPEAIISFQKFLY
jgi:hypothetical protein